MAQVIAGGNLQECKLWLVTTVATRQNEIDRSHKVRNAYWQSKKGPDPLRFEKHIQGWR